MSSFTSNMYTILNKTTQNNRQKMNIIIYSYFPETEVSYLIS